MRRPSSALDDTDRAIIEQLQHDGRLPYTRLGQAVGLSEAAVRQRVQRLIDQGIMQVVAVTDPLSLGLRRMAMIGLCIEGDIGVITGKIAEFDDVDYVVVTAGRFDLLVEVVCTDRRALLDVTNRIRDLPGVVSTESFLYLELCKQQYDWGVGDQRDNGRER